jgi:hypothetical protein
MIVNLILFAVIILQQSLHFIERRDMCNRLMSKDYTEYRSDKIPPRNHIPSAHEQTLKRWRSKGGDE